MNEPTNCPHCKVSLIGEPIPQEHIDKGYYSVTHFKREIGIEIPEKYDGIWYFMCPDCEGEWGGMRAFNKKRESR